MSPPLSTKGGSANRQCFEGNAWCTRAQLCYFVGHTSFGIGCGSKPWRVFQGTINGAFLFPFVNEIISAISCNDFFSAATSSFVSPRSEAGFLNTLFGVSVCLIHTNFYLTAHLTNTLFRLRLLSLSYTRYDAFLQSNYDLQNIMFVVNSWHYFKLQRRIGQLQLISSKCCPALPEAWAPAMRSPAPMRSPCTLTVSSLSFDNGRKNGKNTQNGRFFVNSQQ